MIKILFLSLLLFIGCSSKDASLSKAKEHMIQSNELQTLMHEINMVVYDKFKSELQRDNIRRRYALSLADKIKKLAHSIEIINPNQLGVNVNQNDIKVFRSYAKELNENSKEIYNIAQNYELEKIPSSLENMEKTCTACHNYFRDIKK